MPNFFQKFKQSITHHHSSGTADDKKQQTSNQTPNTASNNNQPKQTEQPSHPNLVKKTSAEHNKKPDLQSIFSITIPHAENKNKNAKSSNAQTNLPKKNANEAVPASTSKSIFSLIIDSSFLSDAQNKGEVNNNENIFDPEPAVEETDTFNHDTVSSLKSSIFNLKLKFNFQSDMIRQAKVQFQSRRTAFTSQFFDTLFSSASRQIFSPS